MRYVMRQKILALGHDFTVRDENGSDVFFVDGKALSLGHKLSFQDMAGNELAFISQKLMALGPTYEVHVDGELVAVVKKEIFTLFNCRFLVDVPGPDDLDAEGDFLDHEYTFRRGDEVVGSASKRYFAWTDTYGIEVQNPDDTVLLLATAIVIDLACHHEEN